jgi:hypothetical protein
VHRLATNVSSRPASSIDHFRYCMTIPTIGHRFSGSCARRKEMCRLAGRHFFHSIAGPTGVNQPDSIVP